MTMRTSRKTVTFRRPFSLTGMDRAQPAGTYSVETTEESIDDLSFPAWRRTATVMLLRPPTGAIGAGAMGVGEDLDIDPLELEAAQDADALNLPDALTDASLGELLADGVLQQAVHSAGLSPAAFRTLLRELAARIQAARRERQAAIPLRGHGT